MPVITVNLWEETLSESTEERVIAAVTDAIVAVLGEQARPFTTVMVVGVPLRRWGTGGVVVRDLEDLPPTDGVRFATCLMTGDDGVTRQPGRGQ